MLWKRESYMVIIRTVNMGIYLKNNIDVYILFKVSSSTTSVRQTK